MDSYSLSPRLHDSDELLVAVSWEATSLAKQALRLPLVLTVINDAKAKSLSVDLVQFILLRVVRQPTDTEETDFCIGLYRCPLSVDHTLASRATLRQLKSLFRSLRRLSGDTGGEFVTSISPQRCARWTPVKQLAHNGPFITFAPEAAADDYSWVGR